jgi:putative Ca2+/H+ antiporter (TMEM165/GDT1 family)
LWPRVGDKLLVTAGVLATRYRMPLLLCGIGAAFVIKMGAAVLAGGLISALPPAALAAVNALTFIGLSAAIWWKTPEADEAPAPPDLGGTTAAEGAA